MQIIHNMNERCLYLIVTTVGYNYVEWAEIHLKMTNRLHKTES